jgi:hypothetical protein
MNWFSRFFHLLYIAYLDCENTLRILAFITIGFVLSLFAVMFSVAYLPPDYTLISWILVSITLWNLGIYLILGFQYIVSLIIVWSMLNVAYIYDNKSWLVSLDKQLTIDKQAKSELKKKHIEMLNEKIGKLKES